MTLTNTSSLNAYCWPIILEIIGTLNTIPIFYRLFISSLIKIMNNIVYLPLCHLIFVFIVSYHETYKLKQDANNQPMWSHKLLKGKKILEKLVINRSYHITKHIHWINNVYDMNHLNEAIPYQIYVDCLWLFILILYYSHIHIF